ERALPSLERALADDHEGVRRRARDAIANIRRTPAPGSDEPLPTKARIVSREPPRESHPKALVVVRARGGTDLGDKLHELVVRELTGAGGLRPDGHGGRCRRRF